MKTTPIAICGAGIAGIATAYYLACKYRQRRIVLVDRLLPLSLTTSKSGENFRELWPQDCMTALMRRSLQLMEGLADEHPGSFELRFSGYDFVSQFNEAEVLPAWELSGAEQSAAYARLTDPTEIQAAKPYLADSIRQVLQVKRAGIMDVQALGQLLLSLAKQAGLDVMTGHISSIQRGAESGFVLNIDGRDRRDRIHAEKLVLAAGPFVPQLAGMLGIELPVQSILQRKIVIPDPDAIIPRDMPFTIFADAQYLNWTDEDKTLLREEAGFRWLLDEFPAGLHIKPEGSGQIKLGWAFNRDPETPSWEVADDVEFPNVVIRGASRFIPALERYVDKLPTPVVEYAGYYTRTSENWPIIGPLDDTNLFTVAALSGFGTMAACGAGELCADWVMNEVRPSYAGHFHVERYSDAAIREEIASGASDGQL